MAGPLHGVAKRKGVFSVDKRERTAWSIQKSPEKREKESRLNHGPQTGPSQGYLWENSQGWRAEETVREAGAEQREQGREKESHIENSRAKGDWLHGGGRWEGRSPDLEGA